MKNVKKVIVFVAVFLGFSVASFAQNGLSIYAGGNFPVGTFSKGDKSADIALGSLKSDLGGAATGVNVGLKYQLKLTGSLSAFASADFLYNGLKEEVKEDLKLMGDDFSIPEYMNIPVMLGANYTIVDILGISLWAEVGAGINFCNITGDPVSSDPISDIPVSYTSCLADDASYKFATSFAWKAGVGVSVAKKVSLGLHYYGFGASDVSVASMVETGVGELWSDLKKGTVTPAMVVLRLGYHF